MGGKKQFGSEIFSVKKNIWDGNCIGLKKLGQKSYRVKKVWVGDFIGLKKSLGWRFKGLKKIWIGNLVWPNSILVL